VARVHCEAEIILVMDQFYQFVSSKDSVVSFPDNQSNCFTISLPKPLELRGHWLVGLCDIDLNSRKDKKTDLYVCCTAVFDSYVQGRNIKILRRLCNVRGSHQQSFNPVQYFTLDNSRQYENLTFTVLEADTFSPATFLRGPVSCTVHFKRGG
jgi:hypothetical protein